MLQVLCTALEINGGGGKTAIGYGRFVVDTETEARMQQVDQRHREAEERARQAAAEKAAFEASLANASEPLRKLMQLQRDQNWERSAGDNRMISGLQQFVKDHTDLPEDCIAWIRTWLESIPNYAGVWDDPDQMTGRKNDRPKYGSKAIREIVKQLNPKFRK